MCGQKQINNARPHDADGLVNSQRKKDNDNACPPCKTFRTVSSNVKYNSRAYLGGSKNPNVRSLGCDVAGK